MNPTDISRRDILTLFGGMAGAFLLSETAFAQAKAEKPLASPVPAFDKDPIKITELTKNFFLMTGPGGNILLVTGADGPVLIDTGVPARAQELAKEAAGVAHHPVTTVINTHFHFDHTGGNATFGKEKAQIIAHENTRNRLMTAQTVELFNFTVPPMAPAGLPILTFNDRMTVRLNGQKIHLIYTANAHTDSDIIVYFQDANIIHTGDLFFNGFYPVIDYSSNGYIGGMVLGLDKVLMLANATTKIIPGHGPLADKAAAQSSRDMLAAVQAKIEPMVKDGKSAEEIVAAKPTAEFDAQWGKGMLNPETFVKMVVTGIQRHHA